jgi:hypothetical protein
VSGVHLALNQLSATPKKRSAWVTGIQRRRIQESARASYAQARLWSYCRRERGDPAYIIPRIFEIEGPLDIERLQTSLQTVVERHEALRTVFKEQDGRLIQVIRSAGRVLPTVTDVAPGEVEQWIRTHSAQRIDLADGPLFLARLARIADRKHVLFLLWHHLISDQRSAGILDEEIGQIYNRENLPEPALQFGDFAEWEPTRPLPEKAVEFWKEHLAGAPPLIELASDRLRPVQPSHRGQAHIVELDPELSAQIRAFGAAHRVTLFPLFAAAWALLLSRYSDSNDLVLGVPVSGRETSELEQVIGYFVNMLPLRLRILEGATFGELVRDCQERFRQCSRYALPFDSILDAVRPALSRSYTPLFQVAVNYLRDGAQCLLLNGASIKKLPFHTSGSLFDLTLTVVERPAYHRLIFEYNADLFDAPAISRMSEHFLRILCEGAVSETVPLTEIRMLSQRDRYAALIERNATTRPIMQDEEGQTVLTCFERSATRQPGRIAIRSGDREWSWRELGACANRICSALVEQGIKPADVVSAQAERSPETVALILAIWKCGAIWLPLDPRWPAERAQFAVSDSKARTVVADPAWWRDDVTPLAASAPPLPESIAYILYTSGSAGHPKGVPIRHSSLLNCLLSFQSSPGLCESDTLLSVTSLSFDISLLEIFLPLISGAILNLPSLETATDPRAVKSFWNAMTLRLCRQRPACGRA